MQSLIFLKEELQVKNNKLILECIGLLIIVVVLIIGTIILEKNNNELKYIEDDINEKVDLLTNALDSNNLNLLGDKLICDKYGNQYYEIEDIEWNQDE